MAVIREDEQGIYVASGGYIAQPKDGTTRFTVGETVKDTHFGGSMIHGVGKDKTCKRGKYLEYWRNAGVMAHEYRREKKNAR